MYTCRFLCYFFIASFYHWCQAKQTHTKYDMQEMKASDQDWTLQANLGQLFNESFRMLGIIKT